MTDFGWALPPGVTNAMIDRAAGGDRPDEYPERLIEDIIERVSFSRPTGMFYRNGSPVLGSWICPAELGCSDEHMDIGPYLDYKDLEASVWRLYGNELCDIAEDELVEFLADSEEDYR